MALSSIKYIFCCKNLSSSKISRTYTLFVKPLEFVNCTSSYFTSGKVSNQKKAELASNGTGKLSQRQRFKLAVRDYGATLVVFHVSISLASLGICYVAISSGVDATVILKWIGFSESVIQSKIAVGSSTFVLAYAVHKLFAPVRIGITLTAVPFIVGYLRKINLIKPR